MKRGSIEGKQRKEIKWTLEGREDNGEQMANEERMKGRR